MKITLRNPLKLRELFTEQMMAGFDFVSMDIGYDGKAYFLFSSRIPPRIDGMFVDTAANAEYAALIVTPSWESGAVENVEKVSLGKHAMNFHFIRPVPDGSFLLLGARCMNSKENGPEKNAVFTDRKGKVLRELTLGDGIADCIVRDDGIIITSYFDEGVFGNYGWDDPIGSCGVCVWKDDEIIWRSERDICDCYAMNTDADGNLWYYYYTDFLLVRTDFRSETEYDPEVKGAGSFTVAGNGRYLIMDGGYDASDLFYVSRISEGRTEDKEPLEFVKENGSVIRAVPRAFSGAKTLVMDENGNVYFADFSALGS